MLARERPGWIPKLALRDGPKPIVAHFHDFARSGAATR
jgi:hypothetical protein